MHNIERTLRVCSTHNSTVDRTSAKLTESKHDSERDTAEHVDIEHLRVTRERGEDALLRRGMTRATHNSPAKQVGRSAASPNHRTDRISVGSRTRTKLQHRMHT